MERFASKVVVVTVAGSGIGEAAARRFSAEGAAVVLVGHHRGNIARVAKDLPRERTLVRVADVAKLREVEAVVESAVRTFGGLDVMVNNAGIFAGSTVTQTRQRDWQRVMDTNAGGVFNGSKAALPYLIRRRGCIVNISSVSGLGADWGMAAYNASKGAVSNLTRALALDYAARGVSVNAVCPSLTVTDMTKDMVKNRKLVAKFMERMPIGRVAQPDDVAGVVAFLASDEARWISGDTLRVDGGSKL